MKKKVIKLQAMTADGSPQADVLFGAGSWFSVSSTCRVPGHGNQCPV